ncbi:MAG: hypothetical protein QXS01_04795 [Candidatus Bathyarchaeia archaeon]
MPHRDVSKAFEILLGEPETALSGVREEAVEASRQGNYKRAQTLLTQAQQMEKLIADIRAKQQEWQQMVGELRRVREVKQKAKRLPRGMRTPEEA